MKLETRDLVGIRQRAEQSATGLGYMTMHYSEVLEMLELLEDYRDEITGLEGDLKEAQRAVDEYHDAEEV